MNFKNTLQKKCHACNTYVKLVMSGYAAMFCKYKLCKHPRSAQHKDQSPLKARTSHAQVTISKFEEDLDYERMWAVLGKL